MRHLLLFLALLAGPVWALEESVVQDRMITILSTDADCSTPADHPRWERRIATNPNDGYRMRYSRFGCSYGARGALVLLPGRGEGSFEYYETAMDFIDRGFSPVYVADHRGQGLSPRELENPHKGHVARFSDYIDDFETMLADVVEDAAALGGDTQPRLYLTTNSMGGAIAIGYLQRAGSDSPFQAAALLGSMILVNYHSYTGTPPSWFNLKLYSETGALAQATWRCRIATLWDSDRCEAFAIGDGFGGYTPGSRQFTPDTRALMTHSAPRYDLRTHLLDSFDWSAIAEEYAPSENWPGPQLGGATNSWVYEGARFNRQMRKPANLRSAVHTPLLLLTGAEDLRAYRSYPSFRNRAPDLSRHVEFCHDLNRESLAQRGIYICEFMAVNGGYHELYKESDDIRQYALDQVDWYFSLHAD